MKYRPEIDGLRALAVVPVILFHAGFELFSGGVIGVDIFFVISGYLITTILIEDIENNRFSLLTFYERRARRIFPALFIVMLMCIPFAWMWMLPHQVEDFSHSLIAVSLFFSNISFWYEGGYFATAAVEKPLIHTWSLAVEEQYYVLFPALLLLTWRFGRNRVFWMIVVFTAISFALSEWGWRNAFSANFYLTPTRAWELFAGSIAALVVLKRGVQANNALSLIGLFAILFSIFAYDESTPIPSVYTLVPVIGVVLLVLFGDKETLAAKLLSTKPFVGIGLISYSAYLWHQPLFAFARIRSEANPSELVFLGLAVASLALAFFSWRYVEQPFRKRQSQKCVIVVSLTGILAFTVMGLGGHIVDGKVKYIRRSQPPNLAWNSLDEKTRQIGVVCNSEFIDAEQIVRGCEFGTRDAENNIVLLGDSHSLAISYQLEEAAYKYGFNVTWLHVPGCSVIPYIRENKNISVTDCEIKFDKMLAYIESLEAEVVVINRWTFRMYPIEGYKLDMPYKNSEGYIEHEDYREYHVYKEGLFLKDKASKAEALQLFIGKLAEISNRTFVIYPVPETAIDIAKINWNYWNRNGQVLERIDTPHRDYIKRNSFVNSVFDNIKIPNLIKIKVEDLFCGRTVVGRCDVQVDGIPLYLDDDHLSDEGARLIIKRLFEGIGNVSR